MAGFVKRFDQLVRVTACLLVFVACLSAQALADEGGVSVEPATFEVLFALSEDSVELLDERSAYSRTVANVDGSRTIQFFGHPVFYPSDGGDWLPIDTAIKRIEPSAHSLLQSAHAPQYAFVADRNIFEVSLGGTGETGYLLQYDDTALGVRPSNVNVAAAAVQHDLVTYGQLWNEAHLTFQVLPDGVKKLIILESPDAPTEYSFTLNHGDLTWINTGARLQFFDPRSGELVWEFQPLFAYDHADEPSLFTDMEYSVQQVGSDIEIRFGISPEWLYDSSRVFPVVIDPKIQISDPGTRTRQITLDHDQNVQWEAYLMAPANTIRDAASYMKIGSRQGSQDIAYHEAWGSGTSSEIRTPKGAFPGTAASTYYFEVQRGHGWSPFTTHYGTARLDITYATNEVPGTSVVGPSGSNWITAPRPEFSWNYTDGDGDSQVSFQIQISRNTSFTDNVYDQTHPLVVRPGATAKWTLPTSLADGQYYWRVRASDGKAWGSWSGRGDFRLDATAPPVPGNVSAPPDNKSVTIRWQSVTDAGSGTSKYEVQLRRGSSWSAVDTVAHSSGQLSKLYSGLNDNEAVSIRVRSVDVVGNASGWVQIETASHAAPTSIVAIEPGGDHRGYYANITVANATASEYRLYRDGVAISPWRPMNSRTYTDSGLKAHGTYSYEVQTRNAVGIVGDFSPAVRVTVPNNLPESPQLLAPDDGAIVNVPHVELTALPGFDPDLDPVTLRFKLWPEKGSPNAPIFVHESPPLSSTTSTPYVGITSPLADGVYQWTVSALDGRGETASQEIRTVRLDTLPPTVSFEVPSNTTSRNITLISIHASDPGYGIDRIEVRNESDTDWTRYVSPGTSIPWTLSPGDGQKTVFMRAIDLAGNISPVIGRSLILDTTPPSVPADLAASGGPGSISLTWSVSQENLSPPVRYDVEYRRGNGAWVRSVSNTIDRIRALTDLGDNEVVDFRVRARDALGNTSEWSPLERGASLAGVSAIVSSPSGHTSSDGHFIDFALRPVATEHYRILLVNGPPGGSSSDWFTAATTGETTEIVYRDDGLTPHGTYGYQVMTKNVVGEETRSETQYVMVANQPPTVPEPIGPSPYATSGSVTLEHSESIDVDGDAITYLYTVRESSGRAVVTDSPSSTATGLVDGETYTWSVKASDGHVSVESLQASFTVDITPPQITVNQPPATWMSEFTVDIDATDVVSGLESLEYRWNDTGPWTDIPAGLQVVAPHGANTLNVRAGDVAGNVGTLNRVYLVDHTPPVIAAPFIDSFELSGGGLGVDGNGIFATWNGWDDESGISRYRYGLAPISKTEVHFDAAVWWEGAQRPRGNTYHALVAAPFDSGTQAVFIVEATNGVGRTSELHMSLPFVIDKSPPVLSDLTLTGVLRHSGVAYAPNPGAVGVDVDVDDSESGIATVEYALLSQPFIDESVTWSPLVSDLNEDVSAGAVRYYAVRATNGVGMTSTAVSSPVRFDPSPPLIVSLVDEGGATSNRDTFWFSVVTADPESGVIRLRYALGSAPGASNASTGVPGAIDGWITVEMPASSLEVTLTNLALAPGTYYVTVEATNGAGAVATASSGGVTIDPTLPARPVVYDEGAFTGDDQSLAAWWVLPDPDGEVSTFRYRVVGGGSIVQDWTYVAPAPGHAATSVMASGFSRALEAGVDYVFEVVAEYADGSVSPTGASNGIRVDKTPPVILSVNDGDFSPARSLKVSWEAVDAESGIAGYRYAVGSVRGATDVLGWHEAGLATHVSIDGLDLEEGRVYYVSVQVTNGAGLVTEKASDGVIIDSTPPPVPFVIDQGSYTNRDDQLEASWTFTRSDPESGTVSYAYAVVPHRQAKLISGWTDVGDATSVVAEGLQLEQGGFYFIAVRATNGAGLTSVGFSDGILVDTTAPDPPHVDDLVDYVTDPTFLEALFTALDLESGISLYTYSLGTYDEVGALVDGVPLIPTGGQERVSLSDLALQDGVIYFFRVQALNQAGLLSATGMSTGVLVDTGYPVITVVQDEGDYLTTTEELYGYFESEPSASNIVEYEVALTTNPNDPSPNWRSNGLSRLVSFTNLELVDGETYYVLVRARNAAGTWTPLSEWGKSDGITVDSTPPAAPVVDDGGDFTAGPIALSWQARDPESGLAEHRYALGTSRGATDVTSGWRTLVSSSGTQSVQLTNLVLEHGRPYYATVQVRNNAGAWSEPGFSNGIVADLTPPTVPEVTGMGAWAQSRESLPGVIFISDDPETGVIAYRYAVVAAGTVPTVFMATRNTAASPVEIDVVGLDLVEGDSYQIAVQFQNGVGTWSDTGYSDVFTVDTIPPVTTFVQGNAEIVTNDGQRAVVYTVSEQATVHLRLEKPTGAIFDETVEIGASGTYSYPFSELGEGVYTLTARAVDPAGNVGESVSQRIRLNAKPRVNAGNDVTLRKGQPHTFAGTASDPDGEVVTYEWNLGDGSEPKEGPDVEHRFIETGTYTVTFTATDNDGGQSSESIIVTVVNTSAGTLFLNETWEGDMHLIGDVVVPEDLALTILPGTIVTVQPGAALVIQGAADVGGEGAAVSLRSSASQNPTSPEQLLEATWLWRGIEVVDAAGPVLVTNAMVSDAARGLADIRSGVRITEVTFERNVIGVHVFGPSAIGTTIAEGAFRANALYGIKEDGGASVTVVDSHFTANGVGPYYDEVRTVIPIEAINEAPGNGGNH